MSFYLHLIWIANVDLKFRLEFSCKNFYFKKNRQQGEKCGNGWAHKKTKSFEPCCRYQQKTDVTHLGGKIFPNCDVCSKVLQDEIRIKEYKSFVIFICMCSSAFRFHKESLSVFVFKTFLPQINHLYSIFCDISFRMRRVSERK